MPLPLPVLLAGITWVFLAKSVVPSLNFLGALGIREVSTVVFFELYTNTLAPVVLAAFMLYTLNVLLPAVAGLVTIQTLKLLRP